MTKQNKHIKKIEQVVEEKEQVVEEKEEDISEMQVDFEKEPNNVKYHPAVLNKSLIHGQRVECLAHRLFIQLACLHELPEQSNTILCIAAKLHDIGWIFGKKDHHKAGAKLIRLLGEGNLTFIPHESADEELQQETKEELTRILKKSDEHTCLLISLVVRYHRKSLPSQKHKRFSLLTKEEQNLVLVLASILRIADAMDYSHNGLVQDFEVCCEKKAVFLTLDCPHYCIAEKERIEAKKKLFESVFKRTLVCQMKQLEKQV